MAFHLNPKQEEARALLGGEASHILLDGGSRSGKTFLILRAMAMRAWACPSRHIVLRYRFSHVKQSIVRDTLPKMMALCFPGKAEHCTLNQSDWFYKFPNGSEIWFGGLDDKERTEKILGNEFATIFLNECSQIPWSSRNMALTRLAQSVKWLDPEDGLLKDLRPRMYYDCNPPMRTHWTYQVFVKGVDPDRLTPLPDKQRYVRMRLNPTDNLENLSEDYIAELGSLPERLRRRFLEGEYGDAVEGALWSLEGLDRGRLVDGELPDLSKIVVAVDPSGCRGDEDVRSDEVGVVVAGLGLDGRGYVLEDLSGRFGPNDWARTAIDAYHRWEANVLVAEINFGGAMVETTLRAARRADEPPVAFRMVSASRGKIARAEPIAQLFDDGKACLTGRFPRLEDQLCGMTMAGYTGGKSPDRADAMIWAFHALLPSVVKPRLKDGTVPGLPKPKIFMPPPTNRRDGWMGTL